MLTPSMVRCCPLQLEGDWFADKPMEQWMSAPWPLMHALGTSDPPVPCTVLLCFAAEGDNIPDAQKLATAAVSVANVAVGEWRQPALWQLVYGGRPSALL
jgi:hypothetical protein